MDIKKIIKSLIIGQILAILYVLISKNNVIDSLALSGFTLIIISMGVFFYNKSVFDSIIYTSKTSALILRKYAGYLYKSDLSQDKTLYKSIKTQYRDDYVNHTKNHTVTSIEFLFIGFLLMIPQIIVYFL